MQSNYTKQRKEELYETGNHPECSPVNSQPSTLNNEGVAVMRPFIVCLALKNVE